MKGAAEPIGDSRTTLVFVDTHEQWLITHEHHHPLPTGRRGTAAANNESRLPAAVGPQDLSRRSSRQIFASESATVTGSAVTYSGGRETVVADGDGKEINRPFLV